MYKYIGAEVYKDKVYIKVPVTGTFRDDEDNREKIQKIFKPFEITWENDHAIIQSDEIIRNFEAV